MNFLAVLPYYIYWHYAQGLIQLARNIGGFLLFELHFFSIGSLLKTFFSPFQRLTENYSKHSFDVEAFLSVLIVNIIMRVVGMCVRTVLLVIAGITLIISIILGGLFLVLWLIIPLLLLFGVFSALVTFSKYYL